MRISSYIAAGLACGLALSAEPVLAQGMGLDTLHAQMRIGSKVCMVDHFHNGASSGKASSILKVPTMKKVKSAALAKRCL